MDTTLHVSIVVKVLERVYHNDCTATFASTIFTFVEMIKRN